MKVVNKKLESQILRTEKRIKELQARKKEYVKDLIERMKEKDISKLELDTMTITLIEEYLRDEFNEAQFKVDYEDLYKKYLREVNVKESLRIKLIS